MRPLALLLFSAFLFVSFTSPTYSLVGKWRGIDKGDIGFLVFDKEGYVTIETNGETTGGKKFNAGGAMACMRYETREGTDPMEIDFVVRLLEGDAEIGRLPGIYKFVNQRTMLLNLNFDGTDRPTKFDKEDPNQIALSRMK